MIDPADDPGPTVSTTMRAARLSRHAVRLVLLGLLVFALYHLVRDVATTYFAADSVPLFAVGHRTHEWCRPVCDEVTMPLELFSIVTVPIALRQAPTSILSVLNLLSIPLWLLASLLP